MFRVIICFVLLLLSACHSKNKTHNAIVVNAKYESSWRGSSSLQPESMVYLASPSDAYIEDIGSNFGKEVHQGDKIIVLSDPKIQDDFVSAVLEYLKNKDKTEHLQKKLQGEKELLAAGILSDDDYWGQKTARQDAYISYVKSKIHLQDLCKLVGVKFKQIAQIKFSDLESIRNILLQKVRLTVLAPTSGLLLPRNILNKDNDNPLSLGHKVDKGELLAAIAQPGSYTLKVLLPVKFSRIITKNTKAFVQSNFGLELKAKIIDFQPYTYEMKNAKRLFPVTIKLLMPTPPLKQPDIYVGMPVNVKIVFSESRYKMLPIQAFSYKDGQYFITRVSMLNKIQVPVKIIGTDASNVFFTGPVELGDDVVLYD